MLIANHSVFESVFFFLLHCESQFCLGPLLKTVKNMIHKL